MDPWILVCDAGTSSLKAVLYGRDGRIIAKKSGFYDFDSPKEGWAEIDPEVWWEKLVEVAGALKNDGAEMEAVRGIALTGQMHSAVLLGDDDAPVAPSILWLDRRAAEETAELQKRLNLPPYKLNSSYTLPKLYWLARHRPDIVGKVGTMLWPKDYLRFRLTGEKVTDYTEGIGAALLDWEKKQWAPERLEMCGIPAGVLPPIMPQDAVYPILPEMAGKLGLSNECRVLVGCGDIAALLGGAPNRKGRLVYSLGSSSMYFTELEKGGLEAEGLYSLELGGCSLFGGVSSTTGASLNWAYEQLWGGEKEIGFHDMIDRVLEKKIENEALLFFPFLAGERSPFWSDDIRGGFDGVKLHHTREHLTLAVMEGVAFSIRYILDLMEKCGVEIDELALAGGGAKTRGWPEIIAAVCDKPVAIYNAEETVTTVLYSLMASALTGDDFRGVLASLFPEPGMIRGEPSGVRRYRSLYGRYKRLLAGRIGVPEQ